MDHKSNIGRTPQLSPWELLYDPSIEQFLGCSPNRVIVRTSSNHIHSIQEISSKSKPIRVFVATASPIQKVTAHTEKEYKVIENCLSILPKEDIKLIPELSVSWENFSKSSLEYKPDIIHIIAHGNEDGIFFENIDGSENLINYKTLYNHFSAIEKLRLIVLSICESNFLLNQKGLFDTELVIPSVNGVWAIILNRTTISSAASLHFSRSFYETIVRGYSLSFAIGSARINLAEKNDPESLQWSIPMIYQASDAILFQLSQIGEPTSFKREYILRLDKENNELLKKISYLRIVLNTYPAPSPSRLRALTFPDIVRKLSTELKNLNYPSSSIKWINTSISLIEEINENLDACFEAIGQAKFSLDTTSKYRKQLKIAAKLIDQAHQQTHEFSVHITRLLNELKIDYPIVTVNKVKKGVHKNKKESKNKYNNDKLNVLNFMDAKENKKT